MRPLIANETKHMLEHLAPGVTADDITDTLIVKWVAGGDGSGRHTAYRACKTDAGLNNHNFILGGMRIEWIKNSRGKIIYLEKSLGCHTEFPHYLIPGHETVDLVGKIMQKYKDEVKDVTTNHVTIDILGKNVTIIPDVEFCQCDGAWLKKISGLGGNIFAVEKG